MVLRTRSTLLLVFFFLNSLDIIPETLLADTDPWHQLRLKVDLGSLINANVFLGYCCAFKIDYGNGKPVQRIFVGDDFAGEF